MLYCINMEEQIKQPPRRVNDMRTIKELRKEVEKVTKCEVIEVEIDKKGYTFWNADGCVAAIYNIRTGKLITM